MCFNCLLHRALCCFCLLDVRAGFRINEVGRVIYGFMFIAPEKQFEVGLEAVCIVHDVSMFLSISFTSVSAFLSSTSKNLTLLESRYFIVKNHLVSAFERPTLYFLFPFATSSTSIVDPLSNSMYCTKLPQLSRHS